MSDFYKPYAERKPDTQFRELVARIKEHGVIKQSVLVDKKTDEEAKAKMIFGHQMRFDLSNGFPIITERDLVSEGEKSGSQFKMALAEIIAFMNGARTQEELEKFGVGWWRAWVTEKKCAKRGLETGDLGPGSYGATMHTMEYPVWSESWTGGDYNGGKFVAGITKREFNQVDAVITQIKERPELRTHLWTTWNPVYQFRTSKHEQKVVVSPCHGIVCHFNVDPVRKTISLHHVQRSADTIVGLVFNLIQYAAVLMMVGQVTGYTPEELVFTTSDTHIYDDPRQWEAAEKMLATEPQKFPTVKLDPSVKDIFAFRPEHFTVEDYEPRLGRMQIWTPT